MTVTTSAPPSSAPVELDHDQFGAIMLALTLLVAVAIMAAVSAWGGSHR